MGLSGTRTEPLESLKAELGERAHVLACNLSDMAAVDALPKQAAEAMGSVDFKDLDVVPDKVAQTAAMVAGNAAHLAELLEQSPYPG